MKYGVINFFLVVGGGCDKGKVLIEAIMNTSYFVSVSYLNVNKVFPFGLVLRFPNSFRPQLR